MYQDLKPPSCLLLWYTAGGWHRRGTEAQANLSSTFDLRFAIVRAAHALRSSPNDTFAAIAFHHNGLSYSSFELVATWR